MEFKNGDTFVKVYIKKNLFKWRVEIKFYRKKEEKEMYFGTLEIPGKFTSEKKSI